MCSNIVKSQDRMKVDFLLDKLGLKLNENQIELIMPSDVPKIGTAGAGAGKTTSIVTASIAEELIKGIPGDKITCITFTRKASREFRTRHKAMLFKLDRSFSSEANISTIHSMCLQYVRIFKDSLGIPEANIMEDDDLKELTKSILQTVTGKPADKISPTLVENTISVVQLMDNQLKFDKDEILKSYDFIQLDLNLEQFETVRSVLLSTQRRTGNIHIDTYQMLFYELLRDNEVIRREVQNRIQSLFVDEFQDTTQLQLEILHYLRGPNTALTVVGDPDQSIYRWRGACDAFPITMKRYPDHKLITMDINYRSPDFVIQSANALIRNNIGRIPSTIKGTGKQGRLEIIPVNSNQQASVEIGNMIAREYLSKGRDNYVLLDKLVLYRNHAQAMFLVYDLASKDIPVVITDRKILPHNDKIVKDIMSIITWLDNPNDGVMTSNCMFMVSSQVNKPKDKSLCPYHNSDPKMHFKDIPVTVKNVQKYTEEIQLLCEISKLVRARRPHREIFSMILPLYMDNYYRRYRIHMYMNKTEEDVNAIERFLLTGFDPSYDMDGIKWVLTKVEQFVNQSAKDGIGLKIFSIHNAKGLEAKTVYLLDWNGSAQPNPNIIQVLVENNSHKELLDYLSEERSLAFVAITRAMEELIVTYRVDNPSPFNFESGLNEKLVAKKGILPIEERTLKALWKEGKSYGLAEPPQEYLAPAPPEVQANIDAMKNSIPNLQEIKNNPNQSQYQFGQQPPTTLTEQELARMAQQTAQSGMELKERVTSQHKRSFDI